MHCPECESFTDILFDKTDVYVWCPLENTYSKISIFLGEAEFEYELIGNDTVMVRLSGAGAREFLLQIGGVMGAQELAACKAVTVPGGTAPDIRNLERVMTLDRLVALSHGQWLRDMVEEHRFTSYFQPIVSSNQHDVVAYEALFRGFELGGSLISPGHIFKTATDAGMMFQLDIAARRSAVERASELGIGDRTLFINFNPTAIYDPSYCLRTTVSACEQLGLKPESIVFEVTETEQVTDVRHLRGILAFYRKAGFRVALDDVGAGYSGLNTLQTLSPDLIKIDRHLVTEIDKDGFKRNIVEHLTSMAKKQDIQVLAEGIETPEEASVLEEIGVDLMQGFYFGKPAETLDGSTGGELKRAAGGA